jgi:uncharacterized protein YkwD
MKENRTMKKSVAGRIVVAVAAVVMSAFVFTSQSLAGGTSAWARTGLGAWTYYDSFSLGKSYGYGTFEKAFADYVLQYTNQERTSRGLNALTWSAPLGTMAYMQSSQMRGTGVFNHSSSSFKTDFQTMQQRLARVGITNAYSGENILYSSVYQTSWSASTVQYAQWCAKDAVNAWMNSSGHRANILNKNYKYLGVGFTGMYATQLFSSQLGTTKYIDPKLNPNKATAWNLWRSFSASGNGTLDTNCTSYWVEQFHGTKY